MTTEQLDNIHARHAEGFAPRMSDATLLLAEVERLTAERDLARLNRDLEAAAFREERTAHGTTRSRVQDAISVLWHRGRIELRLDDATTKTALADALVGMFNEVERLTSEVEMLRGVGCMEDGDGPCGACRKCAFQRGVAAMREAAAHIFDVRAQRWRILRNRTQILAQEEQAAEIRALPDPEDKS